MSDLCVIGQNVLADGSRPQVAYGDYDAIPELENDAAGHWIFDTGDSAGLTDRLHGKVLTAQSAAPTYNVNSISLSGTYGNGLLTPFTPRLDWSVLVVLKWPAAFAANGAHVFGNADVSNDGISLLVAETGGGTERTFTRVTGASSASDVHDLGAGSRPLTDSAFYALGASFDMTGGSNSPQRNTYINGDEYSKTDDTGTYAAGSGRAPGLGLCHYNDSNYHDAIEVAELIYWEKCVPPETLARAAARSAVRGTRRSVTWNA